MAKILQFFESQMAKDKMQIKIKIQKAFDLVSKKLL